jgi:hypothetical protein
LIEKQKHEGDDQDESEYAEEDDDDDNEDEETDPENNEIFEKSVDTTDEKTTDKDE